LCAQSQIPAAICVNKADLDDGLTERITVEAADRGLPILGRVRYDSAVPAAHRAGSTVIDHAPDSHAATDLRDLWAAVTDWLPAPTAETPEADEPVAPSDPPDREEPSMRIAVPVFQGAMSSHFGRCTHFAVFEIDADGTAVQNRQDLPAPKHEPGLFPQWLAEHQVDTVLSGGMGGKARELFAANGIAVVTGVTEEDPTAAVTSYLSSSLATSDNFCEK
jgi:predicted Fe-Mo cluster-binding NifX family protein